MIMTATLSPLMYGRSTTAMSVHATSTPCNNVQHKREFALHADMSSALQVVSSTVDGLSVHM
jgi:hypothetical protein